MKALTDMLGEARQVVPEEGTEELSRRLRAGEPIALIDVRDPDEYRDAHIEGATNISRGFLEVRIGAAVTDPKTPMVVYCQSGLRSVLAGKSLPEPGSPTVGNRKGGSRKWPQPGPPLCKDAPLTTGQ